ncbi:MAG TPA: hypothetical protein VF406_10835 [Thermodesulfobacteriota bacterium]
MAKKIGLEQLVEMMADQIRDGVTANVRGLLDDQLRRIEALVKSGRLAGNGGVRRRGRPRKAAQRASGTNAAIEKRRKRALEIVLASSDGITSVDVAKRMRVDARGVGKLLAGLARDKAVKKDGRLYFPA